MEHIQYPRCSAKCMSTACLEKFFQNSLVMITIPFPHLIDEET